MLRNFLGRVKKISGGGVKNFCGVEKFLEWESRHSGGGGDGLRNFFLGGRVKNF